MARLLQLYRRSSSSSSIIPNLLVHHNNQTPSSKFCSKPNKPLPHFSTSAAAATAVVGVEKSNILRIIRNEIEYQSHYAPPQQPVTEFNSFTVVDRPGEQWATLRGQYEEDESIKIEATMFDGSAIVPKSGYDDSGEDLHLHISLLVDITRGKGWDPLEFVCSAWPDRLEIQKVYVFKRSGSLHQPYLGPSFKDLDSKLQKAFYEFLKERGINDGLARFMHEYMLNKDRIEFIGWLAKIKSFVEI